MQVTLSTARQPFFEAEIETDLVFVYDAISQQVPGRAHRWLGKLRSLSDMGYHHRARTQGDPSRASKILPRIHRVFGNLQTWLRGTHHGVGHTYHQAYLDEFTFRFNRRRTPMAAFQTLLGLGSQQQPTTYKQLYGVELNG